jgi:alkyl-hydroperoxide reductase/thiol specific antioxidant family protein
VFCRQHAVQLHRDRDRFAAAGAHLALIGQGAPAMARDFQRSHDVDLPILIDAERVAYRAAGTKQANVAELFSPGVVLRGVRAGLAAGLRQGRTAGDAAQLGGVLVVAPDGSIPYAHLAEDASDNPPNAEVIEAVERLAAGD